MKYENGKQAETFYRCYRPSTMFNICKKKKWEALFCCRFLQSKLVHFFFASQLPQSKCFSIQVSDILASLNMLFFYFINASYRHVIKQKLELVEILLIYFLNEHPLQH